jgi:hypothetical protein
VKDDFIAATGTPLLPSRSSANMRLLWILAVVFLVPYGCASTEPIVLNLPYGDSLPGLTDGSGGKPSCQIVIAVKDERVNRETLGVAVGQPILADHVNDWVLRRLHDLSNLGYQVIFIDGDYASKANDVVAEVSIQRVYARTVVTQFEAVVLLAARFSRSPSLVTERQYRGSVTRLNWANGRGEITSVLNEALANAVHRLSEDVDNICRGEGA